MPNEQFGEKPRQHGLISQDFICDPEVFLSRSCTYCNRIKVRIKVLEWQCMVAPCLI